MTNKPANRNKCGQFRALGPCGKAAPTSHGSRSRSCRIPNPRSSSGAFNTAIRWEDRGLTIFFQPFFFLSFPLLMDTGAYRGAAKRRFTVVSTRSTFFNCSKINIKFTLLINFKCTVQWSSIHS